LKNFIPIAIFIFVAHFSMGQGSFSPSVGDSGTTAMHKDSSSFVAWVSNCIVSRGYQQINDSALGKASQGDSSDVFGKADGVVVSLGDGGIATIDLYQHIFDGPGADFAVFENGFSSAFLELAFVEVSSNGEDFFRFPATSETQTTLQIGSFGAIDVTEINNLAGKYQVNYGTPFDLSELPDTSLLNKFAVTHIRVIDVVGNINEPFSSKDQYTNRINDPWPTPFPSSGFDLDAIGLIHVNGINLIDENAANAISIYPNPTESELNIEVNSQINSIQIIDISGKAILFPPTTKIEISNLPSGIYFVRITTKNQTYVRKVVKK
jgi:hypothetical protein